MARAPNPGPSWATSSSCLATTLAGLRDRLAADGCDSAAELVGDLVEATDDYLARAACG